MHIEAGFLSEIGPGDGVRFIFVCLVVIQQLGLWTKQIQAIVDYCFVWGREETRQVHFAQPRNQASEPLLIDSSLAAKRRAEALHVVFFATKHPSSAR